MKMDLAEIQKRIDIGLISRQAHPQLPIDVYNYTPKAQYEKKWDEYTMKCRGLILDREGNVIANTFPKFHNLNETEETKVENLPSEMPVITEKIDGCLGIEYDNAGDCAIATRGSFISDQAIWASNWIRRKGFTPKDFKPDYTYVGEIIYPDDCHVVQYGNRAEWILVAVRNTETGKEIDHVAEAKRLGLSYAKVYPATSIDNLKDMLKYTKGTDMEGFVCRYKNGFRVKIKSEDYFRLHKLFFNTSTTSIWESLMKTGKLDDIIQNVPDELYSWIQDVEQGLRDEHATLLKTVEPIVTYARTLPSRKEQAIHIKKYYPALSGIAFSLLDSRPKEADKRAWMHIKPEWQVFKRESVEDS